MGFESREITRREHTCCDMKEPFFLGRGMPGSDRSIEMLELRASSCPGGGTAGADSQAMAEPFGSPPQASVCLRLCRSYDVLRSRMPRMAWLSSSCSSRRLCEE